MSICPKAALVALTASLAVSPVHADTGLPDSLPEALQELERQTEELLGPEARAAIDRLLPMIETLMERLPMVIENLPEYEMPEIMPNGDIIIRRKRSLPPINPDAPPQPQEGIKT